LATITYMRPIPGNQALGPGQSAWVELGHSQGFAVGALAITAIPNAATSDGVYVLKVDNINITRIQTHQGDIEEGRYHAGCNVTNNGRTTIASWSVMVGVIAP
jgi:hypothetical protein